MVFTTPGFTLEVNQAAQHTGLGADGRADPFEPEAAFAEPTFELAAFAPALNAGGWSSQDLYPRELADVNGDGRADIVGFGQGGVWVARANADGSFQTPVFELAAFGTFLNSGGWSSQDLYPRKLGDVNGDGRADIVGFGQGGVWVARANADGSFGTPVFELAAFAPALNAGGWSSQDLYPRELADVNGDGRADIVGFGQAGVWVARANVDGSFGTPTFELAAFGTFLNSGGWSSHDLYPRKLGDVNGDGRADIVGFGQGGVWVARANADGSFQTPTFELAAFGTFANAGGWSSQDLYPRELADVNGDGRADIVGFGPAGIYTALANPDGSFQAPTFELHAYAPLAGSWSSQNLFPRRIGDVNGDSLADIVGFGQAGVWVASGQGGPVVLRDNPETVGPDTNYLQYSGEEHVVLGGTAGNDIIISSEGDDTLWGDGGNDRLDGGDGNDQLRGGAGDDIITDTGGDDNIQGEDGNDVLHGGNGVNLIIGGFGNDFIVSGEDASEVIAGQGNDFILGSKANEQDMGNEGDDWIEKGTSDGAPGDNFDPLGNDPVIGNDVFIGDGEHDKFNGEGGDDIMAGKVGLGDRLIGGSGYDWAIYKHNTSGVYIDISNRFFDQPPVPNSSTSLSRFDFVEGISGSNAADVLNGDNSDAVTLRTAGATGSVLTNIDLIDGLRPLLAAGATFFDGGNIILGGGGSDLIQGRGGNDIIDGDRWLNVRISVRANIDGTGPEIASFDSMEPMVPLMLNGTYNPGQLVIVREILDGDAANADFDTAKFSGVLANYTITTNADGSVTVTDNVGTDGTDTLRNIERLQFADQSIVLGGANSAPVGQPAIVDGNGGIIQVGDVLTVDLAGLTDADNPGGTVPASPVSYFWQVDDGTGFADIELFGAGEVERAHGPSFTVTDGENGLPIRLRVVYQDANGVLEEVFSAPTAPVGTAAINGTPGADTLLGTAAADIIDAGAGNDSITISATEGPDIVDGGADTDTLEVLGDASTETFQIYAADDATAAGFVLNDATEIAIVRNGLVIAELANIEEIIITGGGGGDTFQVIGDFAPTTLLTNTITIDGSTGNDTVNISTLTSAHRIVFKSMGGQDTIVGALRPQDVVELAPGSTLADYTSADNGNGTTTLTNGSHTITFATLPDGASPTFANSGSSGGGGDDGITGAFEVTAADVAGLKLLVNGQEVPGDDDTMPGVRDLSGHGNNVAHPDFGAADEPFIRLTEARYGDYDPAIGNNKINPIFEGLDPRNISNILGVQEADLPKNGNDANIFFMAFGQYFDHGLDFLPKGGNGTVRIGAPGNGAPGSGNPADLTRGTVDSIVDGVPQHINRTSPFADQNQAYGSNGLVGQFLREGDGDGGLGSMLLAGGPDPSDPDFRLLPTLRELILEHWENNTVFTGLPGGPVAFQTYFAGLVDGGGVINTTMAASMASNFMGTGHALLLDANPFISVLDHYIAGDGRTNENFSLTAMHTIWARNHNFHVENLVEAGFQGSQEELFQAAKIINEAEYQRVVFNEFADHLIGGMKGDSHGHGEYNPDATASISHEFAAAVYRVGHSLIGQNMTVLDAAGQPKQVALFDAFLNPTNDAGAFTASLPPGYVPQPGYEQLGVGSILGGIIRQPAEEVDFNIVDAVRNDLVRINADLFAFNVARGWDVGLGTLNQVRSDLAASLDPYVAAAIGFAGNLSPYSSWEDFQQRNNLSEAVIAQFRQAYPDLVLDAAEIAAFSAINSNIDVAIQPDGTGIVKGIDRVDLWVGGLAEAHINGGMVGQTFWVVLHEQFDRLQEADRFYYLDRVENFDFYENFIDGQEFADIIARNTSLTNLPEKIFETVVGDDDDVLLGGAGNDLIDGEADDDTILSGTGDDRITAGAGDDTVVAGAGHDVIVATVGDGNDVYFGDDSDGGTGSDTLDLSAITANLTVDLGTGLLGRGSAVSTQSGSDTLWSIENVATGAGDDTITASAAVNVIEGGAGNDTFRFESKEAADGDTILDFEPGDRLDLSGIDANAALAGDQSFTLTSGPAFTATAQLVVAYETRADGDYTVVKGNLDTDGDADFQLNLKGNHTLTGSNFTL
nr:peroxidase family protein [Bosea sp. LC85]